MIQIIIRSGNIFSDFTDHLSNFTFFTRNAKTKDFSNRPKIRLFTEKSNLKFENELRNVDWNKLVYAKPDVDVAYNSFDSVFLGMFQKLLSFSFSLNCEWCIERTLTL